MKPFGDKPPVQRGKQTLEVVGRQAHVIGKLLKAWLFAPVIGQIFDRMPDGIIIPQGFLPVFRTLLRICQKRAVPIQRQVSERLVCLRHGYIPILITL